VSAPRPTFLTHTLTHGQTLTHGVSHTRNRRARIPAALPIAAALALGLGALAPAASAATRTPISRTALVSDPASYVNPFIGTTNQADDFPGADVPFGMVQWSPDTPSRPSGGGYEYDDSSITGFSLTHLSGPGCPAEGDIPVLPTVGAVNTGATDAFTHTDESASPGYYSVQTSNGVTTELTTTTRSGMARFTFPATTQANLIFKLNGSANGDSNTQFNVVSDTEVSGQVTSGDFCGATNSYTVYFDMVFDHPFTTDGTDAVAATLKSPTAAPASKNAAEPKNKPTLHNTVPKSTAKSKAATASGTVNDGYVTFDTSNNQVVQAKVGISYVSTANAVANRTQENPKWNFNSTKTAAANAWNKQLDQIRIEGGTADQDSVFYTALYHASLHPNVISDVNGQYPGFDGKVHTVDPGHAAAYANYSNWDIYRSQAQLEALIDPQVASDTAQSMLDDYAQTGDFPKWSEDNGESYVMVGDPADSIISRLLRLRRATSTRPRAQGHGHEATTTNNNRPGLNYINGPVRWAICRRRHLRLLQLLRTGLHPAGVRRADYSIASLAKALGDTADYTTFATRAQDWTNVFNPADRLHAAAAEQRRLAAGSFNPPAAPTSSRAPPGSTPAWSTSTSPDRRGRRRHGVLQQRLPRQPARRHHRRRQRQPGRPQQRAEPRTALGVRLHRRAVQGPGVRPADPGPDLDRRPGGLAGNDDLGEMSSWYVWSALGMYPETPGTSTWRWAARCSRRPSSACPVARP
jgi:putative alpha-1,2-mannosidase